MANPSKSLVRQPAPPAPDVDYRFDLTRRAVAAFATAGIAIAFLILLSGVVIGVSMKVNLQPPAPIPESATATPPSIPATRAPAADATLASPPADAVPADRPEELGL